MLLNLIAKKTNRYQTQSETNTSSGHMSKWNPTEVNEIYVFLETTMLMVHTKKNRISDCWSTLTPTLTLTRTVGDQADMTSSSIFQSLNIGMNTSMVILSYPKTRFPEIKSNAEKAHRQKNC